MVWRCVAKACRAFPRLGNFPNLARSGLPPIFFSRPAAGASERLLCVISVVSVQEYIGMPERRFSLVDFTHRGKTGRLRLYEAAYLFAATRRGARRD
jgi:hypothetical protein